MGKAPPETPPEKIRMSMFDRFYGLDCEVERVVLKMFLEQKVVFRTMRSGKPGIYFSPLPSQASIQ